MVVSTGRAKSRINVHRCGRMKQDVHGLGHTNTIDVLEQSQNNQWCTTTTMMLIRLLQ